MTARGAEESCNNNSCRRFAEAVACFTCFPSYVTSVPYKKFTGTVHKVS